jgi:Flp pilus assembly protein TadG
MWEIVLLFPILVGFLLGTVEFSIAFYERQQLLSAVREGARVAARGGSSAEVIATVQNRFGNTVSVTITPIAVAPLTVTGRNAVQVTGSVNTTDVVPNMLPYLIDFTGEKLAASVVMNVE